MIKIEDYLHLYIGCEVLCPENNEKYTLTGVDGNTVYLMHTEGGAETIMEYIKLLLRPLSDMTEDEMEYMGITLKQGTMNIQYMRYSNKFGDYEYTPSAEAFRWMLSKGFDLFGLIESGLAIEKTKVS